MARLFGSSCQGPHESPRLSLPWMDGASHPVFGDRPSDLKRADVTHPEHRPSGSMSFRHIDGKGASVVSSWHLAAQITPPDHPQREHFGRQWCHRCRTSQSVRPNPSGFIIPRWWVSIPALWGTLGCFRIRPQVAVARPWLPRSLRDPEVRAMRCRTESP